MKIIPVAGKTHVPAGLVFHGASWEKLVVVLSGPRPMWNRAPLGAVKHVLGVGMERLTLIGVEPAKSANGCYLPMASQWTVFSTVVGRI